MSKEKKEVEKILGQIFEITDGWKEILDFDGKSEEFEKVYWCLNCLCEIATERNGNENIKEE